MTFKLSRADCDFLFQSNARAAKAMARRYKRSVRPFLMQHPDTRSVFVLNYLQAPGGLYLCSSEREWFHGIARALARQHLISTPKGDEA